MCPRRLRRCRESRWNGAWRIGGRWMGARIRGRGRHRAREMQPLGRPDISSCSHAPARAHHHLASDIAFASPTLLIPSIWLATRRRPASRPRPHQMHHGRNCRPLETQARRPAPPLCHLRIRQSRRLPGELLLSSRPAWTFTTVPSLAMIKGGHFPINHTYLELIHYAQCHVWSHYRAPLS